MYQTISLWLLVRQRGCLPEQNMPNVKWKPQCERLKPKLSVASQAIEQALPATEGRHRVVGWELEDVDRHIVPAIDPQPPCLVPSLRYATRIQPKEKRVKAGESCWPPIRSKEAGSQSLRDKCHLKQCGWGPIPHRNHHLG